jgi:hypothetical protein
LGGGQDIYVVRKGMGANLAELQIYDEVYGVVTRIDRGPVSLDADGWAIAADPVDTVQDVSLWHDGNRLASAELRRPQDAKVRLGEMRLATTVWSLNAPAPDGPARSS